jgi:hypothetical protein
MEPKDQVCGTLYYAFLEIRAFAGDRKLCFALADVLHNVPLQIAAALDGKRTFEEILADIRARFQSRKCEGWLDNVIAQLDNRRENSGN